MSRSPETLDTEAEAEAEAEAPDTNVSVSLPEMLTFTRLVWIFTQIKWKGAYSPLNRRLSSKQDIISKQIVSRPQTYAHYCQTLAATFLSSLTGKRNHYKGLPIQYAHFLAAQKDNEGLASKCEPSKVSSVVEHQTTAYAYG